MQHDQGSLRLSRKDNGVADDLSRSAFDPVYEDERFGSGYHHDGAPPNLRARRTVSDGHLISATSDGYWAGSGLPRSSRGGVIQSGPYRQPERAYSSHHQQSGAPPPGFTNVTYSPQWSPKQDLQGTFSPPLHHGMHPLSPTYSPSSTSSYFQPYPPSYHARDSSAPDELSFPPDIDEGDEPSSRSSSRSADADDRTPTTRSSVSSSSGVAGNPPRSHSRRAKIAAEKARRDQLAEHFRQLALIFPIGDGGGRPSKKHLIKQAVMHLRSLQEDNSQLRRRVGELEQYSSRALPASSQSAPPPAVKNFQ